MKTEKEKSLIFTYEEEEFSIDFDTTSEAVKMTIKKTFESIPWNAEITKKGFEKSDWNMMGNMNRVQDFIMYCLLSKNFTLKITDELTMTFMFVHDVHFSKVNLQFQAFPGEFSSRLVLETMLKQQKEIKSKVNILEKNIHASLSNILSESEYDKVRAWISNDPATIGDISMNLLYRASYDGFASAVFHAKCDGRNPTITVVETIAGTKYGGYASLPWNSSKAYTNDAQAFIFSLTHNVKILYNGNGNAIYGDPGYGPTFGGGHDLYVCNYAMSSGGSYLNPKNSYPIPSGIISSSINTLT